VEFDSLEFDTKKKLTENEKPVVLTSEDHINKSSETQNGELKFSENVSHTSEFNWGFGITVKVETSAKGKLSA
jgi:hypothetical protein